MLNIISAIKQLKEYLDGKFDKDKYSLQYKKSENPKEGETNKPIVYAFTCPNSDLNGVYPKQCPVVVITVDSHNEVNEYKCAIHMCVCNPSVADKETVERVDGMENRYKFKETTQYNVGGRADVALIENSIWFTEQVYSYLSMCDIVNITDINVEMPSPDMLEFPYCVSRITFTLGTNYSKLGQTKWDDLF